MCWGAPAAQPLDPEARQGSLSFLSLRELCGGVHMGMQGHVQCEQCVYRCESLTFVWVNEQSQVSMSADARVSYIVYCGVWGVSVIVYNCVCVCVSVVCVAVNVNGFVGPEYHSPCPLPAQSPQPQACSHPPPSPPTGDRYWLFREANLEPGYPQPLASYGLGIPYDRIDTAIWWEPTGHTFFFQEDR